MDIFNIFFIISALQKIQIFNTISLIKENGLTFCSILVSLLQKV
jgi:hypothetical protein